MELSRTIDFKVRGNSYTMKFPTVHEFMDIESSRIVYSNNTYSQMIRSSLRSAGVALDMIDMASVLTNLCPALVKDLKVPILSLDVFDAKELMTVWNTVIKIWVDGWMALLVTSPSEAEKPIKEAGQ